MMRSTPSRGTVGIFADGFLGLLLEECLADDGYQVVFRILPGTSPLTWIAHPPDVLVVEVHPRDSIMLAVRGAQWRAAPLPALVVLSAPPPPCLDAVPSARWVQLPFTIETLLAAVAQQVQVGLG
ncbi:MAG TPA: hypothetical protein VGE07_10650 [Herpetosiphonaceae bacterium]